MQPLRLTIITAVIVVSFGIHHASAFSVDEVGGTNKDGSSRLADPDDKIPFPHVADDGNQSSGNVQPNGSGSFSFGIAPTNGSSNSGADAFERAKDRMQQ